MKTLIVFGSKSDEHVIDEIISGLNFHHAAYEARICSAHRTPEDLDLLLKKDFSVVIAGAGLAAHLPGVCAAKTIVPVIGVPVGGNYGGMDALLSIMQMPPGIPVLGVGVNKGDVAAQMAVAMQKQHESVNLFFGKKNKAVESCIHILRDFGIRFETNPSFAANQLNIRFVPLDEQAKETGDLIIYVPELSKEYDNAEASLNLLENSKNGLWVGLNRGENAALAAAEIMGIHDSALRDKMRAYRKVHAEKVREDDKEIKRK